MIAVAVATLWVQPSAPGPEDRLALGAPSAIREWVARLTNDIRANGLKGRVRTQCLLGTRVEVLQVAEGWAEVTCTQQGTSGWVPVDQIVHPAEGDADGVEHFVSATATAVRDEPGGDVAIPGVTLGTRLRVVGTPYRGWVPVSLPGPRQPGWVPQRDLAGEPVTVRALAEPPSSGLISAGLDAVKLAQQLLEIPYLHGGVSAYGIDAPGLVWIVYRQLGIDVPRFNDELIKAGEAVDFDDLHPGDLVFLEHGGDPKTPAIMAERGQSDLPEVIFSSSVYGKVVVESLKDSELAGITACRRLPVQA
ncbi:C40 family peptidase [Glycomyces niveus]|uniref:C40 family peptidase n=1 Tax=Glycomyces niveus TaxID=2820287 RepID=A0ABS3TYX3_9ACTN|nr:NlpC/P60 family protein [Glycomyces sp. NEAU-S30]MBO3731690.1 C40 family peptidase [Glycomyces sp. NEAU-S30]